MAQVVYRGVSYNPEEYKAKVLTDAAQERNHELMYRGVKLVKNYK